MRFLQRHSTVDDLPGVRGSARVDRRIAALLPRLRPGDVAVIDHLDLDRANAQALVERGVVAVVNASPFISGRYPNLGPDLLCRSGVVMVDNVGQAVLGALRDGTTVQVFQGAVLVDGAQVAHGTELGPEQVADLMVAARKGLSTQLQSLTHNTTEFLRREQELLLHGEGIPRIRTRLEGRAVVVVVRGYDYRQDLRQLRRFVREQSPVLIGVDAGADALLAAGHRPDILVVGEEGLSAGDSVRGQAASVSDQALRTSRETVLHADRAGHSSGVDRLARLGVSHTTITASGMSEDVALLLADVRGASLIVTVGTHATLDEFLDQQRSGLASTFLTRLRVGPKLVDAKSLPLLYAGRVRRWHLALVLLAGLVVLGVALAATPVGEQWWADLTRALSDVLQWIQGLFS